MSLRDFTRADVYSNYAIYSDPTYELALLRKAEILEDLCEYRLCSQVCAQAKAMQPEEGYQGLRAVIEEIAERVGEKLALGPG